MHTVRRTLCWLFALSSFFCAQLIVLNLARAVLYPRTDHDLRFSAVFFAAFAPLVFLFGKAWWTIWKSRPSARRWALVASVVNIALSLLPFLLTRRVDGFVASPLLAQTGIGIAGLIAFWRPYQATDMTNSGQETLAGDGTNAVLNKFSDFLGFILVFATFPWWVKWCNENQIRESRVPLVLIFFAAGFLLTVTHEVGHVFVGLLMGMRLRGLQIGPFEWRVADGRWQFEFSFARLLVDSGATSVVPTTARFSRLKHTWVSLGGPLVNVLLGTAAMWTAFSEAANSPLQMGGGMALFGAFSIGTGFLNLVPMKTRTGYSDGAQILQLLAGGPWAELHKSFAVVKASLVTPLRPRDLDINGLRKAADGITSGPHALLLRLHKFIYYLDCNDMHESGLALREAEEVLERCADNDISRRLGSEFVFGSAYVLRDALAARNWWNKFEAMKPRINADYWKAACAVHWIEGNLKAANDAWTKGNELAQKMPGAGAYEFDRYCFQLLRLALDQNAATSTSA